MSRPTDRQIHESFHATADTIWYDCYRAWTEVGESKEEFELPRDVVVDYLSIHGGEHGKEVFEWVMNNPSSWESEADNIKLPKYWVE